ncbi:MAG: class I SAM-dependent methyltransferase [Patescibacteria group bacterium]|nr:class I SAM-dependent methyltransferase [Patescibacteria group bacterium]
MNEFDHKKISEFWGSKENTSERYGRGFHWVESNLVIEMINKNTSGDKKIDMFGYFINNYLSEKRGQYTGLSLGCGTGAGERRLQAEKVFNDLEAVDISEEAISQARESAKKEKLNIQYRVDDINNIKLEKNKYDVIIANSSLHHIENLEYIFSEINNSLKDGGLLFVNEYVGPSQFQYTEKQVAILNEILDILTPVYRKSVTDGNLKPKFIPPTVKFMNETDPSEAVRSADIIELLESNFDVVEKKFFGGTLLHMLLQDIVGNFDTNNPKDAIVLNLIIYLEDILIRERVIQSDFVFMILKKNFLKGTGKN